MIKVMHVDNVFEVFIFLILIFGYFFYARRGPYSWCGRGPRNPTGPQNTPTNHKKHTYTHFTHASTPFSLIQRLYHLAIAKGRSELLLCRPIKRVLLNDGDGAGDGGCAVPVVRVEEEEEEEEEELFCLLLFLFSPSSTPTVLSL